eukprot:5662426-Pyramimonas_sp.AAC.1
MADRCLRKLTVGDNGGGWQPGQCEQGRGDDPGVAEAHRSGTRGKPPKRGHAGEQPGSVAQESGQGRRGRAAIPPRTRHPRACAGA